MRRGLALRGALCLCAALFTGRAAADPPPFAFEPTGQLVPGSGNGRSDDTVYAPGLRFPLQSAPAYLNSQVYGRGGVNGPKGSSECDAANFAYPWHDNFCEVRSRPAPLCPAGNGHEGQDIRGPTCERNKHVVVAVADGTISSIGPYSLNLVAGGTRFTYLHMESKKLVVQIGQKVKRGDPLGTISNSFYKNGAKVGTTAHLHFEIWQNVTGVGLTPLPPYTSLVRSYQDLLGIAPPPGLPPHPPPPPAPGSGPPAAQAGTPVSTRGSQGSGNAPTATSQKGGCGCGIPGDDSGAPALPLLWLGVAVALRRLRRGQRR